MKPSSGTLFLAVVLLSAGPVPAAGQPAREATTPNVLPTPSATPGAFLGELTWPEAEERMAAAPLVILPFGAGAKEHGPHLPMNADAAVMEWLCRVAVDSLPVVVAPPILHGWFPAFRGYPGTEVADPAVFQAYVREVALSLIQGGARRLVLLNTGIAQATGLPLAIVAREIRVQTGVPALVVSWDDLETTEVEAFQGQSWGGHADELETSIHLVLQPNLVKMDRAREGERTRGGPPGPGYRPGLFSRDPRDPAYAPSGVSGDPTLATPEKGVRLLAIMSREWLKALRAFSEAPVRGG